MSLTQEIDAFIAAQIAGRRFDGVPPVVRATVHLLGGQRRRRASLPLR